MRRESRKQNKTNLNSTMFITGGILLLAIAAFVITFIVYSNKLDNDLFALDSEYLAKYTNDIKEDKIKDSVTESASSSIGKKVEEAKNSISNQSKKNNIIENTNATTSNDISSTPKKSQKTNTTKKELEFVKPVEGKIIKEYAKDSLVYSDTLKEWTTHLGVDIKAEKATIVKSSEEGIVKYIKNDPRYGLSIIIEHSDGFKTLYANLLTTEFVSEGEKVKKGQTIGTVGDSSIYEIVDKPHLHFEILKDNENINPSEYIKF